MTILFAVIMGIILFTIGLSCVAIGLNPKEESHIPQSQIFQIIRSVFKQHFHTKLRVGLYSIIVFILSFIAVYLYEFFYEPAMFWSVFMLGLPWLILVVFTAATIPLRIEIIEKGYTKESSDRLDD